MSRSGGIARLIADGGPLLLDFDGPVCSIFAGYPAPQVASELLNSLRQGRIDLPEHVSGQADPLEVLRWVGKLGDLQLTNQIEDALCAAELKAAGLAEPTPYGREVIVAAKQNDFPVAIVSNNSAGAVNAYLSMHRLDRYIHPVIGRAYSIPDQMKPNPKPIFSAAHVLAVEPSDCVLVGDSLSDIEAAKAAGARVIGYANKQHKQEALRLAGADEVITSMGDIAEILIDQARP